MDEGSAVFELLRSLFDNALIGACFFGELPVRCSPNRGLKWHGGNYGSALHGSWLDHTQHIATDEHDGKHSANPKEEWDRVLTWPMINEREKNSTGSHNCESKHTDECHDFQNCRRTGRIVGGAWRGANDVTKTIDREKV